MRVRPRGSRATSTSAGSVVGSESGGRAWRRRERGSRGPTLEAGLEVLTSTIGWAGVGGGTRRGGVPRRDRHSGGAARARERELERERAREPGAPARRSPDLAGPLALSLRSSLPLYSTLSATLADVASPHSHHQPPPLKRHKTNPSSQPSSRPSSPVVAPPQAPAPAPAPPAATMSNTGFDQSPPKTEIITLTSVRRLSSSPARSRPGLFRTSPAHLGGFGRLRRSSCSVRSLRACRTRRSAPASG